MRGSRALHPTRRSFKLATGCHTASGVDPIALRPYLSIGLPNYLDSISHCIPRFHYTLLFWQDKRGYDILQGDRVKFLWALTRQLIVDRRTLAY